MDTIKVKPRDGVKVRNRQNNLLHFALEGEFVICDRYIRDRIADGDLIEVIEDKQVLGKKESK
jgi:hypothetical protein